MKNFEKGTLIFDFYGMNYEKFLIRFQGNGLDFHCYACENHICKIWYGNISELFGQNCRIYHNGEKLQQR